MHRRLSFRVIANYFHSGVLKLLLWNNFIILKLLQCKNSIIAIQQNFKLCKIIYNRNLTVYFTKSPLKSE